MYVEMKSDTMRLDLRREYSIEFYLYSRESDADVRGGQYTHAVKKLLVRQTSYVRVESLVVQNSDTYSPT